jgi:amino acid adenylation domain-containing protein
MENVEDVYRLTPVQEGMLFHHVGNPDSSAYHVRAQVQLEGNVDPQTMERAWHEVVSAHPILRSHFLWDGLDEPLQIVRKEVAVKLDPSPIANDTVLDISKPPLFRLSLTRRPDGVWFMTWLCHHLIIDGWSTRLVLREVLERYNGIPSPDPPPAFKTYVDWLEKQDTAAAHSYWQTRMRDVGGPFHLSPYAHVRAKGTGHGRVDCDLAIDGIDEACRSLGITTSTLMHTAWAVLLKKYTDLDAVLFGTTSSGRPAELERSAEIVGMFITTQPLRVGITETETISALASRVQQEMVGQREYEHIALSDVQRMAGIPPGQAFFDTLVVMKTEATYASSSLAEQAVKLLDLEIDEHSEYPLAVLVSSRDPRKLIFFFDRAHFGASTVEQIGRHLGHVVRTIVAAPHTEIGAISLLSDAERKTVIGEWSHSLSEPVTRESVVEMIFEAVRKNPNREAVKSGGQSITYDELWTISGRLARHLVDSGINRGDRVGIRLERSIHHPIAMLGVIRAGGVFVMLDPAYPATRLEVMEAAAGLSTTVSLADVESAMGPALDSKAGFETVAQDGGDLAYLMFTSGSTGVPKAVAVTHSNLSNSIVARFRYYEERVGRFLLLSSVAFDSSLVGLLWTLASGGTLVVPPDRVEQDLDLLRSIFRDERITHTLMIPSLYRLLLDEDADSLRSLHTVIVAGEVCDPALVKTHYESLADTSLHNEYGPTEACVWCTVHKCSADDHDMVPIGRPILNTSCYVLDSDRRPVPIGVAGELYVGGANVSPGYFGDPDLTNTRFVPNPFVDGDGAHLYRTGDLVRFSESGNIEFLGRVDFQVKVRGYRIETGEIENALVRHELVQEAIVVPESGFPASVGQVVEALLDMDPEKREKVLDEIENRI